MDLRPRTLDLLLALVKGRATATAKHPSLNGQKLLLCQPLDANGDGRADPILAVDQIGAGRGDRVMLCSDGQGVRDLLGDTTTPVRWFTLGIVDEIEQTDGPNARPARTRQR